MKNSEKGSSFAHRYANGSEAFNEKESAHTASRLEGNDFLTALHEALNPVLKQFFGNEEPNDNLSLIVIAGQNVQKEDKTNDLKSFAFVLGRGKQIVETLAGGIEEDQTFHRMIDAAHEKAVDSMNGRRGHDSGLAEALADIFSRKHKENQPKNPNKPAADNTPSAN